MKATLSPQGSNNTVTYSADGDVLTVTVNGTETDTFDFTNLTDGKATSFDSTLDPCPVLAAERTNGTLKVTLLHWYDIQNCTEEDKKVREVTL